jgi:hypothetical protein
MCLSKPGIGLLIIFSAFITAGCGELDTILSSTLATNPVYRVNAAVEGRNLDECAIVGVGSQIRPYFLNSIEGDPDITGLVVFLETLNGETASRKVRYVPSSAKQSSGTDTSVDGEILDDDTPETAADQTVSGEENTGNTESGTDEKIPDTESGENREDETSSANDGYSADGNSSLETEDAVVDLSSDSDLFSDVDMSSDSDLSSDSDGGTEKEAVYQIREKKSFSGTGETSDPDELVVHVSKLSADLPALLFPEKLAIGPYILVFQVLGSQGVLSHFEKLIYYISDAEIALGDIQTYYSGNAERFGVVSPDSVIMLETKVSADERLAPYIVWYHGKKRLREGPVSDGVDHFLWRAPMQTGFQAIRAEVFPFAPPDTYKNTGGLTKELSLAISSKQPRRAVVDTETSPPDSVTRWYQFSGNLSDSLSPQDGRRELKPGDDTVVTWLPKTGIYGLAAGSGYSYTIPGSFFTPDKELPGRGQLVFRFAVQSSGIIFNGIFTLERTSQTLKLDLSCDTDANRLILSCALGDEKQEQKLPLPFYIQDEWLTAVVDFIVEKDEFRTELSLLPLGNGEFRNELASLSDKSIPTGKGIVLPGALTGEGVFRLGAVAVPANSSTGRASVSAASAAGKSSTAATVKYGTNDTAAQTTKNTETLLITGEENRNTPALANTASTVIPSLVNTETGENSGTGTPASALILDAIAVLFRVIDADEIAAEEPADEAEEGEAEAELASEDAVPPEDEPADEAGKGEAELASEDIVPPKDVSPDRIEEQVKNSTEKSVSASGTGQNRQSSLPPLLPAKSVTNTDKDFTGEETDLTPKAEEDDQAPDDPETHEAKTREVPAKEPVPNTEPHKGIEAE